MDVNKLLKNVNSLNKYIAVTQDISNKYRNAKIQFNMSSVLSLKKIRSFEIEYFNKSEDNGAACIILERMLSTPPSKTWNILGKELVTLLQYWLDAIRKHLITHSTHWWTFLKLLLRFLKDIRTKDSNIPNLLVEMTAECLLDIATHQHPDTSQRRDILACLNMFCAESGREIRFAMRNKFGSYFIKLSAHMCTCGDVVCQYSELETLVRWLLPRHEPSVRITAADTWLPRHLCTDTARDVFLKRPWMDFFMDARAFLNAHNNTGDLISSVVIRKLHIGPIVVISGTEKREAWLDVNTLQKTISVLLESKVLEAIGVTIETACEALVIGCDDVETAQLSRKSPEVLLSLRVHHTPVMTSSHKITDDDDDKRDVTMVISSKCGLRKFDNALRSVFDDKYQLLLDLDDDLPISPENRKNVDGSEEDTRLSHPALIRRRKHSGYIVGSKNPGAWKSPSTASTSSLAHLHEKLAALPRYRFDKEQVSVCVKPELSSVTELSETDDKHSLNTTSTFKLRSYGVCYKGQNTCVDNNRKSQSDNECVNRKSKTRNLSPLVNDNAASCLLVATIGSDESFINETLERLAKNKDYSTDNIVDLLVQEALHSRPIDEKDKLLDSGINTGKELERIEEEIENTPCEDIPLKTKAQKIPCTVISKSTSDESNTEVVNETPDYVSVRRKNIKSKVKESVTENPNENDKDITFDVNAVEEFFSQHFTENRAGEIVISPTLAKKINETSSEISDCEDQYLLMNGDLITDRENVRIENDIDIIECLNSIVDSVCHDFDKCTEYLIQDNDEIVRGESCKESLLQEVTNTIEMKLNKTAYKPKKSITLNYKTSTKKTKPKQKDTSKKRKHKQDKSKMSTIMEDNETILVINSQEESKKDFEVNEAAPEMEITTSKYKSVTPEMKATSSKKKAVVTPENKEKRSVRRKRKLYSPKDDNISDIDNQISHAPETDEDVALSEIKTMAKNKTPKYKATCYKELEKERRNRIRQPRKRNSRIPSPPSPRTNKMNTLFDKLKETVEGSEKITLADKKKGNDVYNFTSDSEDEDFKKKKVIQNRNSTTTIGSFESTIFTRHGRENRVNYSENISSNDDNIKKKGPGRRKKVVDRRNSKNKIHVEKEIDLVDERMRQTVPVELNTSLIADKRKQIIVEEPELVLDTAPVMEIIADEEKKENVKNISAQKKKTNKKNKKTELVNIKKEFASKATALEIIPNNDDDGTLSPLPGLVVETVAPRQDDENGSISANMLQKYKKIYQEGPSINESNTTQNLLSDIERINNSTLKNVTDELDYAANSRLDYITSINLTGEDEFNNIQITNEKVNNNLETDLNNTKIKSVRKYKPKKMTVKAKDIDISVERIEPTDITNNIPASRSISIATVGITGHGDFEESPPDLNVMQEKFQPRNLSIDGCDQSMKDYYVKLTSEINQCNISSVDKTEINPKINSSSEKSPIVSLQRLSFDDISKWLPSRRSSYDDNSSINYNSVKMISQPSSTSGKGKVTCKSNETGHNDKPKILNKDLSKITIAKTNSSIADSDKHDSEIITKGESIKNRSKILENSQSKVNRKSMISPIKLFEDYQPNVENKSDSSDNEYVKNIRNIFSKNRKTTRSESSKRYYLRKRVDEVNDLERSLSSVSNVSTSTKVYGSSKRGVKRQLSPVAVEVKRKKSEVNNNVEEVVLGSGPSASSIHDWFRKNEPSCSRAERINASLYDTINNVKEKLDTTLKEIQQDTSKRFVHMFVDAQKVLSQMKEQRHSMYKEVAKDVLTAMVKVMDQKFTDLDRRSQEMDSDFMSELKIRATELIREDSNRKHAMVLLLKEDMQAVIEHINKDRQLDSL